MKHCIILLVFFFLIESTYSQTNIDSIFKNITNKNLYVSPLFGGPIITKDSNSGKIPRVEPRSKPRMFMVSTFDGDIKELAILYSEKQISLCLYQLLSDTTRDLFANALLYDLLDNIKPGKLILINREKWIESGKRKEDLIYWKDFLQEKGYL